MAKTADDDFELLLQYLKRARGFDFTGYKRSSLIRRVQKRMLDVPSPSFSDYVDYLEVHPEEFDHLFNTILINVTSFFRDPEAWAYLDEKLLPGLLAHKGSIRIWSAGCATGQEAYSIAMLVCNHLGESQFQERVKIYATDVDEDALGQARQAAYDARAIEHLSAAILERYFLPAGRHHVFRHDLRRSIIFGRHDLVQDAPISKLDLLICRNTLMYLNAETQRRVLGRLHFAVKPEGYLFLGRAEMLLSHGNLFDPIELQHRIFAKVTKGAWRDRASLTAPTQQTEETAPVAENVQLKQTSFDQGYLAQIVVDDRDLLVLANEKARMLFDLHPEDLGRPFKDLELSYRPIELRSLIEQTLNDGHILKIAIELGPKGETAPTRYLQVQIAPILVKNAQPAGVSITFDDVTSFYKLRDDLQAAHEQLESTNEELQSTVEELETTNEELQSANEELETTNEELQSANEELETTNAELQSSNEELETTNSELHALTAEVEQTNAFLQSILAGLRYGCVVVDEQFKVMVWNHRSEELWGLRAEEIIGLDLFQLDIGLPIAKIKDELTKEFSDKGFKEIALDGVNRRGKPVHCLIKATPLKGIDQNRGLVLLIGDNQDRQS